MPKSNQTARICESSTSVAGLLQHSCIFANGDIDCFCINRQPTYSQLSHFDMSENVMGKNQIQCLQTHFVGEIAGLKQCWINVNSVLQFSCTVPLLLGLPDLPETQNSDTSLHIYCGPKSFKISVYMFFFKCPSTQDSFPSISNSLPIFLFDNILNSTFLYGADDRRR